MFWENQDLIGSFKAHLTRSPSTSNPDLNGPLIEEILKRGFCSNRST